MIDSIGSSWWLVPTDTGTARLEVLPAAFGGHVSIREDGRDVARFPKPNGQQPWIEHVRQGVNHVVIVALVWESHAVSCHVFVDGVNLRDGRPIDAWRAGAPKPMDRFEEYVLRSRVLNEANSIPAAFAVAIAVGSLTGVSSGSIPILIASSIAAAVLAVGFLRIVRRFAEWLATKPTWNDGLRAEAVFGLMLLPIAAMTALVLLATRH